MNHTHHIEGFCHVRDNHITVNGEIQMAYEATNFPDFMKSAYKNLALDYPKFFKMDDLSKLGFIAAEVFFAYAVPIKGNERIALAFSNKASSLDTDRKYQRSIQDLQNYYPSPAVFVYTLPNICMGEISIRHKLRTENSFFIFDAFNAKYLKACSENLLDTGKADKVLCGWVDVDEGRYDAFLYLVSNTGAIMHHEDEIISLYNTK